MQEEIFDAVVIGSGFGGSIMAYRLVEAGLSVLVLERGRPYPPGSFPRAPREMSRNFWDPSKGLYGMFNLWSFRGSGAIVSSGLGGGSLIYANVLIRKPEKWFVYEDPGNGSYVPWPVSRNDLDPHYQRVESMMGARPYPSEFAPYSGTPKMLAYEAAAKTLGRTCTHVPIAVSFRRAPNDDPGNPPITGAPIEEAHPNLHNLPRTTCRLCGECDIGCNYGSKNTLDFNYLSEAKRLGAEIRTLCEVKEIAPDAPHGYEVRYIVHDPEEYAGKRRNTSDRSLLKTVRSKYLILSAGSLGSTYLLLKHRAAFPALSTELGNRYSTNGDMLSFLVRATVNENGSRIPRNLAPYFGPGITRGIEIGADQPVGFLLEEWGNPYFVSWIVELSGVLGLLRRLLALIKFDLAYQFGFANNANMSSAISALLGDCITSMSSVPVIAMGQEPPAGTFSLVRGNLDLVWKESKPFYERLSGYLRQVAAAMGGEYRDNPLYRFNFHQYLSAHPLGGCSMGNSKSDGVVGTDGQVFDYPGFYVADGSVMPGPVGVNPALTIGALADRFADQLIASRK